MNIEELAVKLNKSIVTKKDLEGIVFDPKPETDKSDLCGLNEDKNDVKNWKIDSYDDGLDKVVPEIVPLGKQTKKEVESLLKLNESNFGMVLNKYEEKNLLKEAMEPCNVVPKLTYDNDRDEVFGMPDLAKAREKRRVGFYSQKEVTNLINAFPYALPKTAEEKPKLKCKDPDLAKVENKNKNEMMKLAGVGSDETFYAETSCFSQPVAPTGPAKESEPVDLNEHSAEENYKAVYKRTGKDYSPKNTVSIKDVAESTRILWRQLSGLENTDEELTQYVSTEAKKKIQSSIIELAKNKIKSKIQISWSDHKNPEKNVLKINNLETKYNILELHKAYDGLLAITNENEAANIVAKTIVGRLQDLFV